MSESPSASRRTNQLRNDVDDLYNILATVENDIVALQGTVNEHTITLAELTTTVNEHTITLAEHTATLNEHTITLAEHTATLNEHGNKLDHIIRLLEAS